MISTIRIANRFLKQKTAYSPSEPSSIADGIERATYVIAAEFQDWMLIEYSESMTLKSFVSTYSAYQSGFECNILSRISNPGYLLFYVRAVPREKPMVVVVMNFPGHRPNLEIKWSFDYEETPGQLLSKFRRRLQEEIDAYLVRVSDSLA